MTLIERQNAVVVFKSKFYHFSLYFLSRGRLRRLGTKENFKLLALKVVAVTYEGWPLTRVSKYGDLTWKLLVF